VLKFNVILAIRADTCPFACAGGFAHKEIYRHENTERDGNSYQI